LYCRCDDTRRMNVLIQTLHWTHIAFGFLAFFVAPIALASAKGGPTHRRWGKVYFRSMVVVAVTALILSLYRPNYFLAMVSVFSFYLAFRGYRALSRKPQLSNRWPKSIDYAAMAFAFAGSAALVTLSVVKPSPVWVVLGPVAMTFGVFGIILSILDLREMMFPPKDRLHWWYAHMVGMIASYIAAVSAFSVNNFGFLPVLVRWLWPSVVGVPAIFVWVGHYRKRFGKSSI
jgi:uncharacterized membrane protein